MIKIIKQNITFIAVFICLFSLCYSFFIYVSKQDRFHELSNELYTNHHAVLINNDHNYEWMRTTLSESSYRVFVEFTDTYRLLLENRGDWSPPMLSGRFFSNSDTEPKAIIGKEMINNLIEHNQKKYISFQGEEYEVSGIMGASFASATDYLILLHKPNQSPEMKGLKIIIDSDNKATVDTITKDIVNRKPSVNLIESSQKGLSRTANIPFFYHLLKFEVYLLLFLSVTVFLRFWYEKERNLFYVLFLIGVSKRKINRLLFLKMFLNIIISGFLTICLFLIFNFQSINMLGNMLWTIVVFLSCASFILIIFLRLSNIISNRGVVRR